MTSEKTPNDLKVQRHGLQAIPTQPPADPGEKPGNDAGKGQQAGVSVQPRGSVYVANEVENLF